MGEFDGVDGTGGTNDVGNMRYGSTGGGAKVENLGTGLDPDVVDTAENSRGN